MGIKNCFLAAVSTDGKDRQGLKLGKIEPFFIIIIIITIIIIIIVSTIIVVVVTAIVIVIIVLLNYLFQFP